jgi:hypothetical protein
MSFLRRFHERRADCNSAGRETADGPWEGRGRGSLACVSHWKRIVMRAKDFYLAVVLGAVIAHSTYQWTAALDLLAGAVDAVNQVRILLHSPATGDGSRG